MKLRSWMVRLVRRLFCKHDDHVVERWVVTPYSQQWHRVHHCGACQRSWQEISFIPPSNLPSEEP